MSNEQNSLPSETVAPAWSDGVAALAGFIAGASMPLWDREIDRRHSRLRQAYAYRNNMRDEAKRWRDEVRHGRQ